VFTDLAPERTRTVGWGAVTLTVIAGLWYGAFAATVMGVASRAWVLTAWLVGVVAVAAAVAWVIDSRRRRRGSRATAILLTIGLGCTCLPVAVLLVLGALTGF
jgi:uncharacterized membrane protein